MCISQLIHLNILETVKNLVVVKKKKKNLVVVSNPSA